MIKFDIINSFTGAVQFTAEIDCDYAQDHSVKLGLAVKWCIKTGADLWGANLRGADLRGANLWGANLWEANLWEANLRGANLWGANLWEAERAFKACLWMTLTQNRNEVDGLLKALKNGKVNGSQYEGECACLVGTIANVAGKSHKDLPHNSNDPSEKWFLMISEGDTPDKETGGGYAAMKAIEWIEEWKSLQMKGTG